MKNTVDLTANGDFNSKKRINDLELDSILEIVTSAANEGSLHEIQTEKDFYKVATLVEDGRKLFYTGSVKDIRETKEYYKTYTPTVHCDRCGKILLFNIFSNTLCNECTGWLERYFGTYGWSNYNIENRPKDWLALRMRKIKF